MQEPPPSGPDQMIPRQQDQMMPRQPGQVIDRRQAAEGQQAIEPRRPGGGALSPVDAATARRNRRWMVLVLAPALVIGAIALIASVVASSNKPSVHPIDVPAGYHAVGDGYFAYAVPSSWSQSAAFTDDVGDLDTSGQSGFAAEHLGARAMAPPAGEIPPSSFSAFGESQPVPYHLGPATRSQVKGASVAYRYTMTRPGGFEATAIDAWQSRSGAEIWLLIRADPATTAAVLASLQG